MKSNLGGWIAAAGLFAAVSLLAAGVLAASPVTQLSLNARTGYAGIPAGSTANVVPRIVKNVNDFYSEIWVQNTGAVLASVNIDFGVQSINFNVQPGAVHYIDLAGIALPDNFAGPAEIASSEPLAVLTGTYSSSDSGQRLLSNALPLSSSEMKFNLPRQHRDVGGFISASTIYNAAGSGDANVSLAWFNPDGSIAETMEAMIPNGSAVTYFPIPAPAGFEGHLVVTSDLPVLGETALFDESLEGDFSGPSCIEPDGAGLYIRHLPYINHVQASSESTELTLVNLSPGSGSTITGTFHLPGGGVSGIVTDTVASHGQIRIATGDLPFAGSSWAGSVLLESDRPFALNAMYLAAAEFFLVEDYFLSGCFDPTPSPTGYMQSFLPLVDSDSSIVVQNASGTLASIGLTYYNPDGTVAAIVPDTIAGNGSGTYSLVPPGFDGSAVVTSDKPIWAMVIIEPEAPTPTPTATNTASPTPTPTGTDTSTPGPATLTPTATASPTITPTQADNFPIYLPIIIRE